MTPRLFTAGLLFLLLAPGAAVRGLTAETTLLLVDDRHVLYRAGTERVFHPAVTHAANPLVREDQPWEMAIGWTSLWRQPDTGRYQLWYQAYAGGRDERRTHKCVVCYAESADGIQFTKPALNLHDFRSRREPFVGRTAATNIVLVGDGGYGDRYGCSVWFDATDADPARRYKMLYTDFMPDAAGQEWPGFCAAFSPDGVHWQKSPRNPLLRTAYGGRGSQPPFADEVPYRESPDRKRQSVRKQWPIPLSMSDAIDVCFDPLRGKWAAYGKCWLNGPDGGLAWKHAMARVESDDFLTWSPPRIVCSPDDRDAPNVEFHTSPVFFHAGYFFCLNQILSSRAEVNGGRADLMHVELMLSHDGLRWERPFRDQPFIDNRSQPFSSGGVFTNSTPVFVDGQMRFYYGGYSSGATGGGDRLSDAAQQSGVGFASLPLDRFASLRPVARSAQATLRKPLEHVGQVTLAPLELTGVGQIFLNADARGGAIRGELLTEAGSRLRGFAREDALPISADGLRLAVKWNSRELTDLPPGRYLLRLHLDRAQVFAVVLAPTPSPEAPHGPTR